MSSCRDFDKKEQSAKVENSKVLEENKHTKSSDKQV